MSTLSSSGRAAERLRQLKARRGGLKANLTKVMNDLRDAEDDVDVLVANLEAVDAAYSKVREAHETVVRIVGGDVDAQAEQDAYLGVIEAEVVDLMHAAQGEINRLRGEEPAQNGVEKEKEVNEDELQQQIGPGDSASQVGRRGPGSATSGASARAAALAVRAEALVEKQRLEMEELRIKQKKEALQVQVDLAAAEAEASVLQRRSGLPSEASVVQRRSVLPSETFAARNNPVFQGRKKPLNVNARVLPPRTEYVAESGSFQDVIETLKVGQQQMLNAAQMPKVELMHFDGDPLKYWLFMRSFECNVEFVTQDSSARLTRLIQYCRGKARTVVESCICMEPTLGYDRAKRLLKERFGDDYVISQAWVKKVSEGTAIKPREKIRLQEFSDDLQGCVNTLTAMGYVSEVSTQGVMAQIVTRLPGYLKTRWLREVQKCRENGFRPPDINYLAKFVCSAAQEANDPVYGGVMDLVSEGPEVRTPKRRSEVVLNTEVDEQADATPSVFSPRGCNLCGQLHTLFECDKFKEMRVFDRRKYVSEKRLCFNCLRPGHRSASCRKERHCSVEGCREKHSRYLHADPRSSADTGSRGEIRSADTGSRGEVWSADTGSRGEIRSQGVESNSVDVNKSKLALPVVPVKVRAPGCDKEVQVFALLDNGSTATFCVNDLVRRLGVVGEGTTLLLNTMGQPARQVASQAVSLEISPVGKSEFVALEPVFTTEVISCSPQHTATHGDAAGFDHLKDLDLPRVTPDKVSILIGQDNSDMMMPLEVRKGTRSGLPYAIKTELGWALQGPLGVRDSDICVNFVDARLEEQLERFWHLEGGEHLNGPEKSMSVEDQRTLELWNGSVSRAEDGHYVLPIPFRKEQSLPDSRPLAEKRLGSLRKRLLADSQLRQEYVCSMASLLSKGYAEEVKDEGLDEDRRSRPVWYLPHHAVVSAKKVRVVFDCAARVKGVSLNSQVMQGPDTTNDLAGVLLRFRLGPVGVQGDIEAMFHQVRVSTDHRDALRFLWYQDGDLNGEIKVYRMTSHLFGGTWSPACCGFALRFVADTHGEAYGEQVKETVKRNFYVDDCLRATDSVAEAVELVAGLKNMLAEGGFNITKFASNSKDVLEQIGVEDRSKEIRKLDLSSDKLPQEKALGLYWDLGKDVFAFCVRIREKPPTRRGILSGVSSVFDPLGFAAPFTVRGKMLVQELTRLKFGWDDVIPEAMLLEWNTWVAELPELNGLEVARCMKPSNGVKFQLHHFADSSTKAYGTASFLRVVMDDGQVDSYLVMARSRLAPVRGLSIPRLELSAAALAVMVDAMLHRELDLQLEESVFWTDSMVVIGYISNPQLRYHTFVSNRVSAILAGSTPTQWRHVPSALNPADAVSRGVPAKELVCSELWLEGPAFLRSCASEWPSRADKVEVSFDDEEVKKEIHVNCSEVQGGLQDFIEAHSSWFKLRRRVAMLLRVRRWLRMKVSGQKVPSITDPVSTAELEEAQVCLVRFAQEQGFGDYFQKGVHRKGQLASLDPQKNAEGLICVGGRLARASISEAAKHPLILPKGHHIAELVVRDVHEVHGHVGREHVLAIVRRRFWIVSGRQTVRQVLSRCVVCKRTNARPMTQVMSELPHCRLEMDCPPFTNVGMDMFGPFLVKRGRSVHKRYGCLFTCLSVRAIHLEVCFSLDTDSFIHGLHRFMARRGCPKRIFCDNGTNFIGAQRELKDLLGSLAQDKIHGELVRRGVEWHFNPPSASHMGGAWERQIRSVRKVIGTLMAEQNLDEEGLLTLFCVVESIVNSRPLTVVSNDPNDLEPLTPNHLLLPGSAVVEYPEGEFCSRDLYVRRRWRQVQYSADVFWRRWSREYLPTLQTRSKWREIQRDVQVGDVVLLVEQTPRSQWPLARVLEVYPSEDGKVRKVKIKTRDTQLVRPITKLCMLEEAGQNLEKSLVTH